MPVWAEPCLAIATAQRYGWAHWVARGLVLQTAARQNSVGFIHQSETIGGPSSSEDFPTESMRSGEHFASTVILRGPLLLAGQAIQYTDRSNGISPALGEQEPNVVQRSKLYG